MKEVAVVAGGNSNRHEFSRLGFVQLLVSTFRPALTPPAAPHSVDASLPEPSEPSPEEVAVEERLVPRRTEPCRSPTPDKKCPWKLNLFPVINHLSALMSLCGGTTFAVSRSIHKTWDHLIVPIPAPPVIPNQSQV